MAPLKPTRRQLTALCLAALAALGLATALAASSSAAASKHAPASHSLLQSRLLWATIDVCSPPDQPDTVGIRGEMPGNGHQRDTMYMRFQIQYLNGTTKQWANLTGGAASAFVSVGSAKSARQAGRSFTLTPVPGKPAFTLRGLVTFQWQLGTSVLQSTSRATTAGHHSLAGADPASFSAATCLIG